MGRCLPQAAQAAETAAAGVQAQVDTRAIPVRQYLEATVVPLMMQVRVPLHSSCNPCHVACEIAGMWCCQQFCLAGPEQGRQIFCAVDCRP